MVLPAKKLFRTKVNRLPVEYRLQYYESKKSLASMKSQGHRHFFFFFKWNDEFFYILILIMRCSV